MIPGEYSLRKEPITLYPHRPRITRTVINEGDRPIQVGSHFHFYEVNLALVFEREGTQGYRLDIPSGTAIRFEPGDSKQVQLVQIGGSKEIHGFSGLINGRVLLENN